ncbi:MAG: tRNA (adenosine(37)-N6)-dimethylallyltransferase MiaA [Oscillospiraceae bacterium]|jgi:tRNA dimethylallyltransferase|nr:tRNA (adenosine(37)-N6)-dimethylallyltransferase MiaA [Oscillospiraceae bacterium]
MAIPLIGVVGPTASGKTQLGAALAKHFGGEVVSADSMQIYKTMDIASAKPTAAEMDGVPHHLIGFLPPEEPFSLAQYLQAAKAAVADICGRGKVPVLVGGTGLYVHSLVDNVTLSDSGEDPALRAELWALAEREGGAALLEMLRALDPETAALLHENNRTRIIRAIEVTKTTGIPFSQHLADSRREKSPYLPCLVGLTCKNRQLLYDRIDRRVDRMLEAGLLEEARQALGGGQKTAAQAIGHKELRPYLLGEETLETCVGKLKQATRRYAKRQLTWFRRDPRIQWIYLDEEKNFAEILKKSVTAVEKSGILC